MEIKKVFTKAEQVKEVKEDVKEPKPEVKEKEYENVSLGIVKIGNEWGLIRVSFSDNHNECKKEVIRTDMYKDVIFEEFKISVTKEIM